MARLVEAGCGRPLRRVLDRYPLASRRVSRPTRSHARSERRRRELGIPRDTSRFTTSTCARSREHRQDILELLVALWEEWRPDAVFQPSLHDIHQDHQVVAAEGLRAFKRTTILGYEIPWNNFDFAYQAYVSLQAGTSSARPRRSQVQLAAAPPLLRPRVHLERRTDARDQREPGVRGGIRGLPAGRVAAAAQHDRIVSPTAGRRGRSRASGSCPSDPSGVRRRTRSGAGTCTRPPAPSSTLGARRRRRSRRGA